MNTNKEYWIMVLALFGVVFVLALVSYVACTIVTKIFEFFEDANHEWNKASGNLHIPGYCEDCLWSRKKIDPVTRDEVIYCSEHKSDVDERDFCSRYK